MNPMHDLGEITRNGRGRGHVCHCHCQTLCFDEWRLWRGLHYAAAVVWVELRFEKEFAGFVLGIRIAFLEIWSLRGERRG